MKTQSHTDGGEFKPYSDDLLWRMRASAISRREAVRRALLGAGGLLLGRHLSLRALAAEPAASARAKLDIRSESVARLEELAAILTGCVEKAIEVENDRATGGRVSARITDIGMRPGGKLADDAAILNILRAVDAHLAIRAQVDCASTDANIPLSMGIPAVAIGAGGQGGGAHTPGEWYNPEGRDLGLRRILLALYLLLGHAGPAGPDA